MSATSGSETMSWGSPNKMLTNFCSPTRWLPGRKASDPDCLLAALEGDPRGDRDLLGDRPVRQILVGIGLAAAGQLVQRLVVPHPQGVDAEQLSGDLPDALVERQRPDVGVVLPQVHALDERLLVAALVGQRAVVAATAPLHRGGDGGAVAVDLVVGQEIGHDDEPVLPEALDELGVDRCGGDRHGPPGGRQFRYRRYVNVHAGVNSVGRSLAAGAGPRSLCLTTEVYGDVQ